MSENLIKPYEISVWEDKLTPSGFEEVKIAVIGSNTMTGYNKVYDPVFNKKTNGEKTLSFSLRYKYFDPYTGNDDVINPFAALLVNERKVKLHYDNQWYEFIVKDHTESSDGLEWSYTCSDAFVIELSKQGYNITFDSELNNNQGSASELAAETIKNTDWQLGEVDNLIQLVAEPIYKAVLTPVSGVTIINASNNTDPVPTEQTDIYVFYSYIKNQSGKYVQFILRRDNERQYTIDDNNVITDTNFRIMTELVFEDNQFKTSNGDIVITLDEIETRYQANRLAYNQLTTYDPVMARTVDRFVADDIDIYRYTDYTYTTSNVITNFITNGENFNVLEDGTLQGWNPYTDQSGGLDVNKLELLTYPELGTGKELVDLSTLSEIEGYLKITFNGAKTIENNQIYNTVFNSGIENHTATIQSIAKGEKFVFRWRAGTGELGQLTAAQDLGLIVARYTQDSPTRFGFYYKHINPSDIIFETEGTPQILNNYIEGGHLIEEDSKYVIDDVVQVPSSKYIYKDNDTDYIWSGTEKKYVLLEGSSYLPYYYTIAIAQRAISNKILTDPTEKIGIFIYNTTGAGVYYIQDIQLTKYVEDANNQPIIMGNVPTATSTYTEYYYVKPSEGTAEEDVELYTSLDALKEAENITAEVEPLYNEGSEKILTISASQSNCFNILQTIAETFECWIDLVVEHESNGAIKKIEGVPQKFVYLKEYIGKDNWAGFKYGINLNSIERTVNSDEIVTKLIVDQSQSDYVDEGFVSIASAPSNTSNESYILNFDYYYNQGLLDRESAEADRLQFNTDVAEINKRLQEKEKEKADIERSLTNITSKRNVFTELVETAQDNLSMALSEFEELTNMSYDEYREKHGQLIEEEAQEESFTAEDPQSISNIFVLSQTPAENTYIIVSLPESWIDSESEDAIEEVNFVGGQRNYIEIRTNHIVSFNGENTITFSGAALEDSSINVIYYLETVQQLTEEDTIFKVLGEIYVNSATINNYSGLLINVNQEYWRIRKQLYGTEDYTATVKVVFEPDINENSNNDVRHIIVNVNDYVVGFKFTVDEDEYETTVSKKYFDILAGTRGDSGHSMTFTAPTGYSVDISQYTVEDNVVKTIHITCNEPVDGIADELDEIREEKEACLKAFNNKYSRFIQEGTWNSTDYIDSELYYLDALQVSNTSAQPTVSYTINVVEVSELEGLEWYLFDAGDKTYVEDTEFFGWADVNGVLTPAREEVIVSEVEWHLDEPEQNVITVQNYKTRFEDLFQRISATVQTVQYNEATYAKISSLIDANGSINQDVLLESLNRISGQNYNLTSDGSVTINGDSILIQNLTNSANRVIINSEGIRISSDGGNTWRTAISGRGIDVGVVYTGTLNTDNVIIGNSDNPSFRWDKSGISAYKSYIEIDEDEQEVERYDLKTYVRYDQYGLYGIKDNGTFKAQSLDDVLEKAHFAVTWDGFFIKNNYEGGGRVEITSENDFRVLNTVQGAENEKIKIGALEWEDENGNTTTDPTQGVGAPTLYGIRIKNNEGVEVMKTDDDGNLTIIGTIEALGANFSQMVTVGKNDDTVTNWIEIDGVNSLIQTSDYGAGRGWMINKDGDAVFNNITARGAIKTAVFEYAEIQAVGGIFIFRPSSTIRSATVDGNDLVLTVEKPVLFKEENWCKISNYTAGGQADDPDVDIGDNEESAQDILQNNGLSHVYQISDITTTGGITYITLDGAAAMIGEDGVITEAEQLIGGALVDMGNSQGTANYGIGINSSDNSVNLPARAISLFETTIHPNDTTKITYDYQGILGTLPTLPANKVSPIYSAYMRNKQGIFTNNMYIGDKDQYIAFYKDGNGDSQLRLVAKSFEILPDDSDLPIDLGDSIVEQKIQYTLSTSTEENTVEEEWSDTPYEESSGYYLWQRTYVKYAKGRIQYLPTEDGYYMSAGQPGPAGPAGPAGEDAAVLVIDSSEGTVFRDNTGTTDLTVTIFYGSQVITNVSQMHSIFGNSSYLEWEYKDNTNNWIILLVNDPRISNNGFTLSVDAEDVYNKANFRCKLII